MSIEKVYIQDALGYILNRTGILGIELCIFEPSMHDSAGSCNLDDDPRVDHLIGIEKDDLGDRLSVTSNNMPNFDFEQWSLDTSDWGGFLSHLIGNLDSQAGLNDAGKVVGLMSNVHDWKGRHGQLCFFDMEGIYYGNLDQLKDAFIHSWSEFQEGGVGIFDSGKSHHVYTKLVLEDEPWKRLLNTTHISRPGCGLRVDPRWCARAIHHGVATIRLTRTAAKPALPKGNHDIGEFLNPAPWLPQEHAAKFPVIDNDLPF